MCKKENEYECSNKKINNNNKNKWMNILNIWRWNNWFFMIEKIYIDFYISLYVYIFILIGKKWKK